MTPENNSRRFTFGSIMEKWWMKVLELIAFIVLFSHLLPKDKLEAWGESGIGLVFLLGISIISLLVINYTLTFGYAKEIQRKESSYNERFDELSAKIQVLEKKGKYADIFQMINKGFKKIHYSIRKEHAEESDFKDAFREFCEMLSKAFTHIIGEDYECHVCMKMCVYPKDFATNPDPNRIEVKTIFRSSSVNPDYDRTDLDSAAITHPIIENTDFQYVISNKTPFFCNDLCQLEGYRNSSFKKFGNSFTYFDKNSTSEHRRNYWPLAYRSSIVAPLLPSIRSADDIISGFVCIDNRLTNAFNENIDKEIIGGCCDGIYNTFQTYLTNYLLKK